MHGRRGKPGSCRARQGEQGNKGRTGQGRAGRERERRCIRGAAVHCGRGAAALVKTAVRSCRRECERNSRGAARAEAAGGPGCMGSRKEKIGTEASALVARLAMKRVSQSGGDTGGGAGRTRASAAAGRAEGPARDRGATTPVRRTSASAAAHRLAAGPLPSAAIRNPECAWEAAGAGRLRGEREAKVGGWGGCCARGWGWQGDAGMEKS